MQHSTDRILTTHTGSLPRPLDLAAMLEMMDSGIPPDPEIFKARTQHAVAEVVRQQVDAGVDIMNDGEQSKVGYSTYVRYRLTGFEGSRERRNRTDWADFPQAAARLGASGAVARPACNGPIDWKDKTGLEQDITALKTALSGVELAEAFMTAASPGVIAHFLANAYYLTSFATAAISPPRSPPRPAATNIQRTRRSSN